MRAVSNFNTGFPHMTGHISNHAATLAEVLNDQGYATFAVGKWHLAPMEETSAAGPFDQWPLQRGFDRYYGFLEGETDQFNPTLTYDNHHIEPPGRPEDGYHVSEDLIDRAIGFVHDTKSVRPDKLGHVDDLIGRTQRGLRRGLAGQPRLQRLQPLHRHAARGRDPTPVPRGRRNTPSPSPRRTQPPVVKARRSEGFHELEAVAEGVEHMGSEIAVDGSDLGRLQVL